MKKLYFLLSFFITLVQYPAAQLKEIKVEVVSLSPDHYQFVNKKSKLKVNEHVYEETEPFTNGFARVFDGEKWGFADGEGKVIIKPAYISLRNFHNHLAAARLNNKWGFINEKNQVIIPYEYEIVFDFKERVTAAYKKGQWYLLNTQGIILKNLQVEVFKGFNKGKAEIIKNGRKGIMNLNGDISFTEPPVTEKTKRTVSFLNRNTKPESGTCPPNIDFEDGNFTGWNCFVGSVASVGTDNVITVTPSLPTTNRHEIIPASNPSQLDPYGLFPINPPDGSGYCVKLGNDINGRGAERISYQINVPANSSDASITYRYAVVFQDPGHLTYEQPRFSAKLLDVLTNTYLPCATYEYISTSSIPGFNSSPVNDTVKYKTWASVYVNLSKYAGRTLILEFTTADCTRGAHWGYAYVDVGDCNIAASVDYRCNPNQATFTAPPGFEFYNWWSSDFSTLYGTGEKMIMNSPPVPGTTIHVEVIPYNGFGCSDTLDVPYTVNFPVADAGPDKAICGGIATTIGSNAISGTSYSWSPATNLSNPNSAFPIANPSATTTYIVTATSSSTGCFTKDTVTININPKPAPVFSTTPSQCFQDNRFSFSNTSSINQGSMTYFWDFADNSTAIVANPIHSYTSTGTFNVKLIATSNSGCKDSAFQEVKVNPHPNVAAGDDLAICRGSSTQLQVSGAQTYEWLLPAQNLSCTDCASPFASPVNNSTYIVKGTDVNGCPGYDTINIVVHQPIQIAVSPGRTICDGDSVAITLQVTGSAASYAWTPAQSLNNSAIQNPVASPHTTTQYRVIGYDGHNCFSDTGYININVNPTPKIDLGPDLVLPTGTVYPLKSLIQNGPIINWHWSPATDLNCTTCPEPSATVKNNIIYYTTVTNIHNCIASDSVRIRAFCEGSQVFIPNAFTPDGDGRNDILMVRANGIQSVRSFRIYSRWGELVFEKNNFPPNLSSYGWDGKIKGVTGPAEVYVYIAEVICENLQTYVIKGNTTILK